MQITITTLASKRIDLEVDENETIASVKLKLQEKQGWNAEQMRLILNRKSELKNDTTIAQCNWNDNSTIHMILSLNGDHY